VLETVPDRCFWSGSGLEPNCGRVGGPGHQYTRNVSMGTVRWKSPNRSELGGLSAGHPVAPSVDS